MSSWLLLAAGAGLAGGGAGAGAGFAAAGFAVATGDGGTLFITGALAAGAAAAGFSGLAGAAGAADFSATAGFASSSAMMRRIDAKISSIEGSWTFAGCVISDSTSSTPSRAFYTKQRPDLLVPDRRSGFSSHKPDLSPDQALRGLRAGLEPLLRTSKRRATVDPGKRQHYRMPRESLCCLGQRYVRAANDCKNESCA
jgi:hypothetical protein